VISIFAWAAIAVLKSKNTIIKMILSFFIIIPPFDIIERKTLHAIVSKRFGLFHDITPAIKYLNQSHSGESQNQPKQAGCRNKSAMTSVSYFIARLI
jgi:hypothetical protein